MSVLVKDCFFIVSQYVGIQQVVNHFGISSAFYFCTSSLNVNRIWPTRHLFIARLEVTFYSPTQARRVRARFSQHKRPFISSARHVYLFVVGSEGLPSMDNSGRRAAYLWHIASVRSLLLCFSRLNKQLTCIHCWVSPTFLSESVNESLSRSPDWARRTSRGIAAWEIVNLVDEFFPSTRQTLRKIEFPAERLRRRSGLF